MNLNLLDKEVQHYISEHLYDDISRLVLKKSSFPDCSSKEIAEQIEAKLKIRKKLPTWFSTEHIYYANKLNLSQTSSEATASYKAKIVNGNTLIDLSAGFGVDSFAFSKKIKHVWHLEKNVHLSEIAKHNFNILNAMNINVITGDGIDFLKTCNLTFDCIYLDPSRRSKTKEKVFFLSDCEPNITEHLDLLFSKSNQILIKTGPLLDIKAGISQLKHIKSIHIVALNNEVKEVLWELEKDYPNKPLIKTVDIHGDKRDTTNFYGHEEKEAEANFSEPLNYLYEPNSAILKSGAYKLIGNRFDVKKIGQHSHLYTSKSVKEFPGRRFKILKVLSYNKTDLKKVRFDKVNVTVRNFPDSVSTIRKKLRLKDGGTDYLFFTKNLKDKLVVIHCFKIR